VNRGGAALRAIIFDFNSVIADHETPHLLCFQQALAEAGLSLSREEYYGTYLGMDERTCATALLERRDGICDPTIHAGIIERKAGLFREHTTLTNRHCSPGPSGSCSARRERTGWQRRPAVEQSRSLPHSPAPPSNKRLS